MTNLIDRRAVETDAAPARGVGAAGALTRAAIRSAILARPAGPAEDMRWLSGATPELLRLYRAAMPERCVHAAVLVPLVSRPEGWTVLLTQRSAALKDHAGQISFPGGRIEPDDADAWAAALREAQEEVGLSGASIEFAGYLPDHLILTGFRVTPAVAFVAPDYLLRLDASEVEEAFEVPLSFLFDAENHRPRRRSIGELSVEMTDIPYGPRNIWGATAGMLMTLRRLLIERTASPP